MAEREPFVPMLVRGDTVRALVVGYGAVGRRKAGKILAGGGAVLALDPAASPERSGRLEVRRMPYSPADLAGCSHVLACTGDPALNARIAADAAAAGLPANDATGSAGSTFVLPAALAGPNFALYFTGLGANPSAALFLKRLVEGALDLDAVARHVARLDAARAAGDGAELDRLARDFDAEEFLNASARG